MNGASNEHHHNLKRLQDEYREYKVKLKDQGHNSMDVMDLEIPVAEPTNIVEVREKQVEELVKQNGTVSSGRAFKIVGFTQVTSKVFTDAGRVAEERKQAAQEKKRKEKCAASTKLFEKAREAFKGYVARGRMKDKNGFPIMSKADTLSIFRFIFPKLVQSKQDSKGNKNGDTVGAYNSQIKANNRLRKLKVDEGIDWEFHMDKIIGEVVCV